MSNDDYDFGQEMADLDEYEMGVKLHPEETYFYVITGALPGFTSTKKPKLSLSLEYLDGEFQGHKAAKDIILSPEKPAFFWKQMSWLGISYEWAKENEQTKFSQLALLLENVTFEGKLSHREYPENSGNYSENIDIKASSGNNPNIGEQAATTGVVQPPVQDDSWSEEEAAAAEPVGVAVGSSDADDPWGTEK